MQRVLAWAVLLVLCFGAAATVAVACTGDSEGLELIDGELPGGG